jgi:hypothetical protein
MPELCLDTVRVSDGGEPGLVLDQRPVAGTDLSSEARQSSVTLTLGAGLSRADVEMATSAVPTATICRGDRAGLFEKPR